MFNEIDDHGQMMYII